MSEKFPVEKPANRPVQKPVVTPEVQAAVEGANSPQVQDNPVASPPLNAEIHPMPSAEAVAARAEFDKLEQGGGAVVAATAAPSPDDLAALVHAAAAHGGTATIIVRNESDRGAVQRLIDDGKRERSADEKHKLNVKVDPGLGVRGLWRASGAN